MAYDPFTVYQLTPPGYVPDNRQFSNKHPKPPHPPLVMYSPTEVDPETGEPYPIGFTWNQGDSVFLEFITEGEVTYDPGDPEYTNPSGEYIQESAKTYLTSKTSANYPKHTDNGVGTFQGMPEYPTAEELGLEETDDEDTGSEAENPNETDAESYFGINKEDKVFQVLVYNFRHEVVAWCETLADTRVRVLVDSFYPSSLVKGTYKLRLNLIDRAAGVQTTLIPRRDDNGVLYECLIFIK